MKLTCDLCGGELQINAGGQGAVCCNCGLTYPVERLKEKMAAQSPVKPVEENVIYDVVDYMPIENPGSVGNSQEPPARNAAAQASSPKPSAAEAKKAKKRMRLMWILLGIFFFTAIVCVIVLDEPVALASAFFGLAFWIVLILLIFKPWKVYGGKAI